MRGSNCRRRGSSLPRGIDPSEHRRTVKIARADTFKVIAEEWLEMQAERLAPITMTKARWIIGLVRLPSPGLAADRRDHGT